MPSANNHIQIPTNFLQSATSTTTRWHFVRLEVALREIKVGSLVMTTAKRMFAKTSRDYNKHYSSTN